MDPKPAFQAIVEVTHPNGRAIHIVEVYRLTLAEQVDYLNRAILGYDACHPDGPGDMKFAAPETKETP